MIDVRSSSEIDVATLETLDQVQLLKRRGTLKIEIADLGSALVYRTGRPKHPENNSPAWNAYRAWRAQARADLLAKKRELHEIQLILTERQFAAHRSPGTKPPIGDDPSHQARQRRLREMVTKTTPETLVLEAYRVIRHLLLDGMELPETLDDHDREALAKIALFLRDRYGRGTIQAFTRSQAG